MHGRRSALFAATPQCDSMCELQRNGYAKQYGRLPFMILLCRGSGPEPFFVTLCVSVCVYVFVSATHGSMLLVRACGEPEVFGDIPDTSWGS